MKHLLVALSDPRRPLRPGRWRPHLERSRPCHQGKTRPADPGKTHPVCSHHREGLRLQLPLPPRREKRDLVSGGEEWLVPSKEFFMKVLVLERKPTFYRLRLELYRDKDLFGHHRRQTRQGRPSVHQRAPVGRGTAAFSSPRFSRNRPSLALRLVVRRWCVMQKGKYYEGMFNDCAGAMLQAGLLRRCRLAGALALVSVI